MEKTEGKRQAGRQVDRQAGKQASRQIDRQAYRQAGREEGRHAGRLAKTDRQVLKVVMVNTKHDNVFTGAIGQWRISQIRKLFNEELGVFGLG